MKKDDLLFLFFFAGIPAIIVLWALWMSARSKKRKLARDAETALLPPPPPVKKTIAPGAFICSACAAMGQPKTTSAISGGFQLFLWLVFGFVGLLAHWAAFLIPLFFTIIGAITKKTCCASCGAASLIPVSSPVGRDLVSRHHPGFEIQA